MVYIDDIVVYSKTMAEHLQYLNQVFTWLYKAGLTLDLKKCNFIKRSLAFLGHIVFDEGVKKDPSKVFVFNTFFISQSIKDVQRFLGLEQLIPNFSEKATSLHALKQKINMDLDRAMSTYLYLS